MEQPFDYLDQVMNALGVPPTLRPRYRAVLQAQLSENGHASFALPLGGVGSPLPFFNMGPNHPNTAGTPPEQQMINAIREQLGAAEEEDKPMDDAYSDDLSSMLLTLKTTKFLQEYPDKSNTLAKLEGKLLSMQDVLAENISGRVDDYIATRQRAEHERKNHTATAEYQRWQRDVLDGRTKQGFAEWQSAQAVH